MKKAINLRLDESVVLTLERLSSELHTTKTDIIEKSIRFFSKHKNQKQHKLLEFVGILDDKEAKRMLKSIEEDKNSKDFSLDVL